MIDGWSEKLLRPGATALAVAVHVLVLMGVTLPHPSMTGADEDIEIAITQAGDAAAEPEQEQSEDEISQQAAQAAQKPEDGKEEPVKDPEPDPEPQKIVEKPEEVAAEAPKREVEDSEAIAQRLERIEEKKERQKRLAADAAEAQEEHRARSGAQGGAVSSAHARAAYAHRLLAEIRRHQLHPPRGGVVRVAFSVSAGGYVSASVASSSGEGMLDAMAVRIVRACHPGPPPGGHFAGTVAIRFN
jgi:TonB family protein